jgi:hypothetical protein
MHDARILEGGLLAVHRTSEARFGQIVLRALARRSQAPQAARESSATASEEPGVEPILLAH